MRYCRFVNSGRNSFRDIIALHSKFMLRACSLQKLSAHITLWFRTGCWALARQRGKFLSSRNSWTAEHLSTYCHLPGSHPRACCVDSQVSPQRRIGWCRWHTLGSYRTFLHRIHAVVPSAQDPECTSTGQHRDLGTARRLEIALDIAKGLAYLHNAVIHPDVNGCDIGAPRLVALCNGRM